MIYTIYSGINGQIIRVVQTTDIQQQLQENQLYIEGFIDDSNYYIENGIPVEIPQKPSLYAFFDFDTKQWVLNNNLAVADVYKKRKELLVSSDWTQIPNGPLTAAQQAAWANYRQRLRDVTAQSGYPFNVLWPIPPQ